MQTHAHSVYPKWILFFPSLGVKKMAIVATYLDCVSLECPSVFMRSMEKLATMRPRQVLEVITESHTPDQLIIDYKVKGYHVLSARKDKSGFYHILVEK